MVHARRSVRDVRLGNRTSVALSWKKGRAPTRGSTLADSVSCWLDRNIVSVTDQCDAGNRSLHRERPKPFRNGFGRMSAALLKRGRTRRPRSRHFNLSQQAQRSDVRFRAPEGTLVAPGLKSLAFDDYLPESPFENGARLHYRSPRGLGELPRGATTYKRSGFHLNSEEVRCVQGLWTQAALLANEQWKREFRRVGAPEASHASATMCL